MKVRTLNAIGLRERIHPSRGKLLHILARADIVQQKQEFVATGSSGSIVRAHR